MAGGTTVVDRSPPEAVAKAIRHVNQTPALRIRTGAEALWALFKSPGHSMTRKELDKAFGALELHFGWFCRRVAEELGDDNPDALALVDHGTSPDGEQTLVLKASVVAALASGSKTRG